jgi:enterochelin esterase-like enzyme
MGIGVASGRTLPSWGAATARKESMFRGDLRVPVSGMKRVVGLCSTPDVRDLAFGVILAGVALGLGLVTGAIHDTYLSLVTMGFDPDRAQLIRALLVAATVAAASSLANGRVRPAVLIAMIAAAALFGGTFIAETQMAFDANSPAAGAFDPLGWIETALTLVLSGVVSAWSGATLARGARPAIAEAAVFLRSLVSRRRMDGRGAGKIAVVAVAAVLLVGAVPVFGDLVNYSPDARMYKALPVPLGSPDPSASGGPSIAPWRSWLPTGSGRIEKVSLPAPWIGTASKSIEFAVYLPPGYDADSSRRYPAMYEVPWPVAVWNSAINTTSTLDSLIDAGSVPPSIVVFVDDFGAPYPDTECADSFDGRQHYDSWLAETLVPWLDANYRTIARPAARGIMGMSQGGYCSSILALHHPDIFGSAISFSGYFHAGSAGPDSALPFGGAKSLIDADSPDVVIDRLAPEKRSSVYFVLVAERDGQFYGRQTAGFDALLTAEGYPHVLIDARQDHGWVQVRQELCAAMAAWAVRMVASGVF